MLMKDWLRNTTELSLPCLCVFVLLLTLVLITSMMDEGEENEEDLRLR